MFQDRQRFRCFDLDDSLVDVNSAFCCGCNHKTILSAMVETIKLATVTNKVLIITAAKPKGAISKITRVTLPLTVETAAFLKVAERGEIYIIIKPPSLSYVTN
jgi:hypothetical protein